MSEELLEMDEMKELMEQFPQVNTMAYIMDFNEQASIMRVDQDFADSLQTDMAKKMAALMENIGPEKMMAIGMAAMNSTSSMDFSEIDPNALSPQGDTYVNFYEESYAQTRPIMDREFLVTGDRQSLAWKLSDEEHSFLGHRILKATAMQDTVVVEAWFTPEIPLPAGPMLYGGLPGLVLILSRDGENTVYTAQSIDLEAAPEVIRPTGEEMAQDEFEHLLIEKFQELQSEMTRMRNNLDFNF